MLRCFLLLFAAACGWSADQFQLGSTATPAGSTIYSGGAAPANTQVVYSNGTTLTGNAGLTYTAASNLLVVNHNAAALPAVPVAGGTMLQVGGIDGTNAQILVDAGGASVPSFSGRRADTSIAAPATVVNNDVLCQLNAFGYDGTSYITTANASVQELANETWSATAHGTKIALNVTVPTTLTSSAALTLLASTATQISADAATNSSTTIQSWQHSTTGTAANGFGSTLQVQGADDGGTQRAMSQQITTWTTAASATRSSKLVFNTVGTAALVSSLTLGPLSDTLGVIGTTWSGNINAGVQDGTADTAGAVGEVIQGTNQSTYANFTTTNTLQQLAVLTSLARGRYRIVGIVTYSGNGATVAALNEAQFAISTTTASIAGAVEGRSIGYLNEQITSSLHSTITIDTDVNLSAATSYFLNGKTQFTAGNPQYVASLTAYRLR